MKIQNSKIVIILFLLASTILFAQVQISGRVTFKNKGVKDVNITLKDTYDGTTTDENGNFSFETSETGEQTLQAIHPKYEEIERKINISNEKIDLSIEMREQISEIEAVVISAGSIEASDKKRATALFNPIDVYTTAGSNGQVSSFLETQTGVQIVGESEGVNVRGGTGNETKFFMDGNLINNYFGNSVPGIKAMDRLNTSIFKGTSFSSGGYSAQYGQALSSVVALESVDLPEKNSADFFVSPIFVNGGIQRVNKERTNSFGISAGYSNLELMKKILNFNTNFEKAPTGFDVNANFRIKTAKGGFIKYYGSYDNSSMRINNPSLESDEQTDRIKQNGDNTFHSISYREKLGKYTLNLGASYTYNRNLINFENLLNGEKFFGNDLDSKANYYNAKAVLEKKLFKISNVKIGIEHNNANEETGVVVKDNSQIYTDQKFKFSDRINSIFAEGNIGVSNDFSLQIGTRAEHAYSIKKWNIAPRFAMAYRISKDWVTSLAYGIFYQNPESRYYAETYNPNYQRADHYIFQLQRNSEGRVLRLEGYYKKYEDLLKTTTDFYRPIAVNNNGSGYAKGIELFWRDKKTFKNIDYWVSYSYLDSKRNYLNYTESLFPNYAAKHTLSIVTKKFVTEWKTGFNLSYSYNSGRPFYHFVEENGKTILKNSGKVKDYSALNFSVNYIPSIGKKDPKSFSVFILSINNVLGTKNIFGYNFSQDGTKSSAIKPVANTFVFVGWLISFGTDKTQDAINNNL